MNIENSIKKRSKANIHGNCLQLYIDYTSKEIYLEEGESFSKVNQINIPINTLKKEYKSKISEGYKVINGKEFESALKFYLNI